MTTISEIMAAPVITGRRDEQLGTVIERMHRHRVGSVVITEGRRAVGIITERDILGAAAGGELTGHSVAAVMTAPVESVEARGDAADAMAVMQERGFRHMPVTDNGLLTGVVSLRDLARVARIGPTEVPRGLKGVMVTDTSIGAVRGNEGFYHYRQYSAVELARTRPLEDVWQLVIDGNLPADRAAQSTFADELRGPRELSPR